MSISKQPKVVELVKALYNSINNGKKLDEIKSSLGKGNVAGSLALSEIFIQYISNNGYKSIEEIEDLFGMPREIIHCMAQYFNQTLKVENARHRLGQLSAEEKVNSAIEYGIRTYKKISETTGLPFSEIEQHAKESGLEDKITDQLDHDFEFRSAINRAFLGADMPEPSEYTKPKSKSPTKIRSKRTRPEQTPESNKHKPQPEQSSTQPTKSKYHPHTSRKMSSPKLPISHLNNYDKRVCDNLIFAGAPLDLVSELLSVKDSSLEQYIKKTQVQEFWLERNAALLQTCEENNINTWDYLAGIVEELSGFNPLTEYEQIPGQDSKTIAIQQSSNRQKLREKERGKQGQKDAFLRTGAPLKNIAEILDINYQNLVNYKNKNTTLAGEWQKNKKVFKQSAKNHGLSNHEYLKQQYTHLFGPEFFNEQITDARYDLVNTLQKILHHKSHEEDRQQQLKDKHSELVNTLESFFYQKLQQEKKDIQELDTKRTDLLHTLQQVQYAKKEREKYAQENEPAEKARLISGLQQICSLYKEAEDFAQFTKNPKDSYPVLRDWVVSLNAGTYSTNQEIADNNKTYSAKITKILKQAKLEPLIVLENY